MSNTDSAHKWSQVSEVNSEDVKDIPLEDEMQPTDVILERKESIMI